MLLNLNQNITSIYNGKIIHFFPLSSSYQKTNAMEKMYCNKKKHNLKMNPIHNKHVEIVSIQSKYNKKPSYQQYKQVNKHKKTTIEEHK